MAEVGGGVGSVLLKQRVEKALLRGRGPPCQSQLEMNTSEKAFLLPSKAHTDLECLSEKCSPNKAIHN